MQWWVWVVTYTTQRGTSEARIPPASRAVMIPSRFAMLAPEVRSPPALSG